ncbi:MAG: hypothetical protein PWR01_1793 [Clostridiales bacterium]|nr:hypothetical protein [Clostridiales bacterium]
MDTRWWCSNKAQNDKMQFTHPGVDMILSGKIFSRVVAGWDETTLYCCALSGWFLQLTFK